MQSSDTLTPAEAAEILKLKPDTVVRLIRSGKLRGFAVGGGTLRHRWVLKRSDVLAYLEDSEFVPAKNLQPEPRPRIQRAGFPLLEKYRSRA